jgi:predicted deacylase
MYCVGHGVTSIEPGSDREYAVAYRAPADPRRTVIPPTASCSIDLLAGGKEFGAVVVPRSTNDSGWGALMVPIVRIAGVFDGPTVVLLGGNHGDEPEGTLLIANLVSRLGPDDVHGRVIALPCLSPDASAAQTRLWPTGANLNRSFPGSPTGSVDERLADFLTRVVFPLADVVIDLHSGGRSMAFAPMSHMKLPADAQRDAELIAAMRAWNSDLHMIYPDAVDGGLLPAEVERQGRLIVTTELGGGGWAPAPTLRLAARGLENVLRHVGLRPGVVETRASLGLPPAQLLLATDPACYHRAPASGLCELLVHPGEAVAEGDALARVHDVERLHRSPETVVAAHDGVVCCVRSMARTPPGAVLAVVGVPTDETLGR